MEDAKVMIVDDEERLRSLVRDFLNRDGIRTIEAADGEEALTLFFANKDVDEYVTKPFSPRVLVARVRSILRRHEEAAPEVLEAAGITLNKTSREVIADGVKVELSLKEFELLTYFMENPGTALSREKILNHVWNYNYYGDARTIDTHVKTLRSKIGSRGECIKTIWGVGYKFEA